MQYRDDPKKTAEVQEALRQLSEDAMAKKPPPKKTKTVVTFTETEGKGDIPKKPPKKGKR